MSFTSSASDRGQTYLFETLAAALLLVFAALIAMHVAAPVHPTPQTTSPDASTNADTATSFTTTATHDDAVVEALLQYNTTADRFSNATGDSAYQTIDEIPPPLHAYIDTAFHDTNRRVNIDVTVNNTTTAFVNTGDPGSDAYTTTTTVTLYDNDTITTGPSAGTRLDDTTQYFTDDQHPHSPVYAVVHVRVTTWKPHSSQ